MSNKVKRNIAFVMLCLSIGLYIGILIKKLVFHQSPDFWMWIAPLVCFIIFLGLWRNYNQAVREDDKYGPLK